MSKIVTFYSFKGGVGRSMSLANVAHVLAKWNYKVLIIDWDLEAPGLENFFRSIVTIDTSSKPGLINILTDRKEWQQCIHNIPVGGKGIDFIAAGEKSKEYFTQVRSFDVKMFYQEQNGGVLIEKLRNEWRKEYDFVLIDSRTGVTDIGGICTIQLPDILVLLFTATDHGFKGILDVALKAFKNQKQLRLDRTNLIALPIPSRIERTAEYSITNSWLQKFASGLTEIYAPWLPSSVDRLKFIENTLIPHIPVYSYGENLPVTDGMSGAGTLGMAYETLSSLVANHLDHAELLNENRSKLVASSSFDYKKAVADTKIEVRDKVAEKLMAYDEMYYDKVESFIDSYIDEEIELPEITHKEKLFEFWVDSVVTKIKREIPISVEPVAQNVSSSPQEGVAVPEESVAVPEQVPVSRISSRVWVWGVVVIVVVAVSFGVSKQFMTSLTAPPISIIEDSLSHLVRSSQYRDSATQALSSKDTVNAQKYLAESAINALDAKDTLKAISLYKEKFAIGVTGATDSPRAFRQDSKLDSVVQRKYNRKLFKIELFYVTTETSSSEPLADSVIKYSARYPHFVIVKQELTARLRKKPAYQFKENEIRYNASESEIVSEFVSQVQAIPGLEKLYFYQRRISYPTPEYVSVFLHTKVTIKN